MGFDLSGVNPKMNMKPEELSVYNKYKDMDFKQPVKGLNLPTILLTTASSGLQCWTLGMLRARSL